MVVMKKAMMNLLISDYPELSGIMPYKYLWLLPSFDRCVGHVCFQFTPNHSLLIRLDVIALNDMGSTIGLVFVSSVFENCELCFALRQIPLRLKQKRWWILWTIPALNLTNSFLKKEESFFDARLICSFNRRTTTWKLFKLLKRLNSQIRVSNMSFYQSN